MTALYDHTGQRLTLGRELGRGGEGAVFEVARRPDVVAKRYLQPPTPERADKLRALAATADADLLKTAAWPTATLHLKAGGPVVGVLMPRVGGHHEIHELYSPAQRRQAFPQADWAFLAHVAMNIAHAFDAVHSRGHVIGDVNQSNVMVHPQRGTVMLIDCDSMQVAHGGQVYPCEVGVPPFTPPELQGKPFRGIVRTARHDRFGLAVLTFHLLFMGRHPFAGRFLGAGEMPIEKAIAEGRFAFGAKAGAALMAAPPKSLSLDALPRDLAELFERAFALPLRERPAATEWAAALKTFKDGLSRCPVDAGHLIPPSAKACPWCALVGQGAPNFFLGVALLRTPTVGGATFDVVAVWAMIEAVPPPVVAEPTLPGQVVPQPLPSGVMSAVPPRRRLVPRAEWIGGVLAAASLLMVMLACGIGQRGPALVFIGLGMVGGSLSGGWAVVAYFRRMHAEHVLNRDRDAALLTARREYDRRMAQLRVAQQARQVAERPWRAAAQSASESFAARKAGLSAARQQYDAVNAREATELQALERNAESSQRQQYLEQQFLAKAEIPHIGPARKAMLASYGIETAADITAAAVDPVPGFGPATTARLVDWRKGLEKAFRFDRARGVPPTLVATMRQKYAAERQTLAEAMRQGAGALQAIRTDAMTRLTPLAEALRQKQLIERQAMADVAVFNRRSLGR